MIKWFMKVAGVAIGWFVTLVIFGFIMGALIAAYWPLWYPYFSGKVFW